MYAAFGECSPAPECRLKLILCRPGLNYLRLAEIPVNAFAPLDKAILGVQAAMHLYTIIGLEQLPPRLLSGLLLGLIGTGTLLQ